jgi:hypothetical protein
LHIPTAFLDRGHTFNSGYTLGRDAMGRKRKKPKRFTAVEAVKTMARTHIGEPPASRVVPDRKRKKSEKHKPTLGKLLDDA